MKAFWVGILFLLVMILGACTEDQSADSPNCDADQLYDEQSDECVDRPDDPDAGSGDADVDDEADDADADADTEIDPECDKDEDGDLSIECGGGDCDDDDPDRSSEHPELCDEIDNNCDGQVNGGLDCTYYAHTDEGLYSIDPFALTANKEADLVDEYGQEIDLQDIDTHPDGVLYGVNSTALYAFYDQENYWIQVASMSDVGDANGLAIDNGGTAYITVEDHFFYIDLADIEQTLESQGFDESQFNSFYYDPDKITISGGDFYSSGDCVVSGKNTFYMTSKHDPDQDHFVEIDRQSGDSTAVGGMGITQVYGLTVGWGDFYGMTSNGELISFDHETGASEVLEVFEDKRWYGAASTPGR